MPENKKKEKKGLFILLVIILFYVLAIVAIAIYVKLDKAGYFLSQEEIVTATQPSIPQPQVEVQPQEEIEEANVGEEAKEVILPSIQAKPIPQIIEEADDSEDEYSTGMTIADVPAGPRPTEDVSGTMAQIQDSDVLNISDLHVDIEEPLSAWESITESISNFFGAIADFFSSLFKSEESVAEDKVLSPEKLQVLEEIDGELAQMQTRFMSYTEESGLTWIDHVNKPNPYEDNGFYMYIGLTPTGHAYHRTVIRYSGKEWIGLKNILLQTNTSDKALLVDVSENRQTNQIEEIGSMNEWVDLAPTQENNNLLNTAVASDNVKITFMGDLKNVEWILSEEDLMILRESMYYYNLLKEKEDILK